jgi:hypothetical protein
MKLREIWKKLKKIFLEEPKRQTLFLYCTCKNELTASESFVSDDLDGVKYECTNCSRKSVWNFDLFAIPVDITGGKYPSPREMGLA